MTDKEAIDHLDWMMIDNLDKCRDLFDLVYRYNALDVAFQCRDNMLRAKILHPEMTGLYNTALQYADATIDQMKYEIEKQNTRLKMIARLSGLPENTIIEIADKQYFNLGNQVIEVKPEKRAVVFALMYRERYDNKKAINNLPALSKKFRLSQKALSNELAKGLSLTDKSMRIYEALTITNNKKSLQQSLKALENSIPILDEMKSTHALKEVKTDITTILKTLENK